MAKKVINKHGILTIMSNPSDAMVTINGVIKSTPALFKLRGKALPYEVMIEKAGYDDCIKKVLIQAGTSIEISITLMKTME